MKKLLLASTALVATAGFAAADVAISGGAEMGVKREAGADRTEFHTDISVTFTMSGESDNGLSFGAKIGLEEAQDGVATDIEDDYTVFVSAGAAKLTMGDTDGAFDKALTEVGIGSSLADDHTSHAGYNGNSGLDGAEDGQVARFDYTFSGVTLSISAEIDDDGETAATAVDADPSDGVIAAAVAADTNDNPVWGIGVAYSAELAGLDLGVGLGYQSQADNGTRTGISLSTKFDNGLQAIINYSKMSPETGDDSTHSAIGFGYSANALTVGLNYGVNTTDGDEVSSGLGLAVNYDLGGGLSAQFGFGSSQYKASGTDDTDSFSLGLAMSF
ncbi:MAG: porin [Marinovum sp.]|nr:porin [Marinovum sp.]